MSKPKAKPLSKLNQRKLRDRGNTIDPIVKLTAAEVEDRIKSLEAAKRVNDDEMAQWIYSALLADFAGYCATTRMSAFKSVRVAKLGNIRHIAKLIHEARKTFWHTIAVPADTEVEVEKVGWGG